MTEAITQAAARAAYARRIGDEATEAYWTERVLILSDQEHRCATAADVTVARLDGYTQEQHQQGIDAARERIAKRRTRQERASEAAHRLHCATFDELKGSPDHSVVRHG